jgi:DNA mismatch repair protein MutS2
MKELDLHRRTVEEAIPLLEIFIYRSYQSGLSDIRIIHGKGTGILRREIGRYLSNHPLVERFYQADYRSGGEGATEVKLCEK